MIILDSHKIGEDNPPFIIAELSANHGGSIERAKKSIFAAKKSGANAVKIQTYTPDTMTINSDQPDFIINDGLWEGNTLYELYQKAYTPYEWHAELFEYAKEIGITIFSSPFDESAIDLLSKLNTPAYKIASFELTDIPLIEYAAKRNKPMLISTGMASIQEIAEAVEACKKTNNDQILLFHCISSYPADTRDINLSNISYLSKHFDAEVGLSDHTTNNFAASLAISLGASAIEKHFKLDHTDCGPDSSFSIDPTELKDLVNICNLAKIAMGSSNFKRADSEQDNIKFRRSLYFVSDLKKGDFISEKDIRRIRPGFGLEPKYFHELIGKKLLKSVKFGDRVKLEDFEN